MDRAAIIEQVLERAATYPQEYARDWTSQGHYWWHEIPDLPTTIAAYG